MGRIAWWALCSLTYSAFIGAAAADDSEICFKGTGDAAIAACTAVITSCEAKGMDLPSKRAGRGVGDEARGAGDKPSQDLDKLDKKTQLDCKIPALLARGNQYFGKGDYDQALQDYSQAIELDPNNAIAFYDRANVHSATRNYDRAIMDYGEAIRINPTYARAFNNRCFVHNIEGRYDRAIEDCSQAIRHDPRQANFFVSRGNAYNNKGDYDHALQDYNKAIELDPGYVNASVGRSNVLIKTGEYKGAIQDLNKVISVQPTNATAWNNRCWAKAILGKEKEALLEALSDCNEAVRLRPTDPHSLDSRAFTYLKLGSFDKTAFDRAISDYDQVLLISSKQRTSLYGRGIAKLKKGDAAGKDDVEAAKAIKTEINEDRKADIVEEFRSYGIQ